MNIILALVVSGFLLLAAEIFLPGIICGVGGAICLMGAAVYAFTNEGPVTGFYVVLGELILGIGGFALWSVFFPNSRVGRRLALSSAPAQSTSGEPDQVNLIGKTGTTVTPLHPAGIALIEGKRFDVLTEGIYVEISRPVVVAKVEGSRIIVRPNP